MKFQHIAYTQTQDSQRESKEMAAATAEAILRCVFDGSISIYDMEIDRRPYHRNCSCAIHKLKALCSINASSHQNNISYSKKPSLDDYSLSMSASRFSSQSSFLVRNGGDANEFLSQKNFIRE